MKRFKIPIAILVTLILAIVASFFVLGSFGTTKIGGVSFVPVLISGALVDSVNPCAFSVLILTIAFLTSLGASRMRLVFMGGMYILGIFVVYLGIGLGLLKTFDVFGIPHFLGKIGAAILLIFGALNVLGYIFPNFPIKFKIPNATHGRLAKLISKATLPATFLMGALVALFEFPCTGGPYLLVLGLLHDGEKFGMGFLYLILYNVIFVLPLIVILLLASDKILMTQAEKWKKHAAGKGKLLGGLAMIILAFVIFLTS